MKKLNIIFSNSLYPPFSLSRSPYLLLLFLCLALCYPPLLLDSLSFIDTGLYRASLSPFPRASSLCLYHWYQSDRPCGPEQNYSNSRKKFVCSHGSHGSPSGKAEAMVTPAEPEICWTTTTTARATSAAVGQTAPTDVRAPKSRGG